jgi:hypothetical protein
MSHHGHDHDHGGHHVQAHAGHGGATHHPSGRPSYFTEQEWADFQRSDRASGGMVVGLMAAIFTAGLLLYTTVALIV